MKVGVLALNFGVYFHIKLAAEYSLREDLIKVTPKAIALWGILVLDRSTASDYIFFVKECFK